MKVNKLTVIPPLLTQIPQPPRQLFHVGMSLDGLLQRPRLAIVGSRKVSHYGKQVTMQLAGQLAEQGIVIVSGLALGVDSLAHEAALEAGGICIAVLPSPLNNIVPATNRRLAEQILKQGGALISEYAPGCDTFKNNFVERNRLMSGLADAVLITEAAEKSGSLHTAAFALEQGRTVLTVPGNITSPTSVGTNNLLKQGAVPVTSFRDVLHALGLQVTVGERVAPRGRTPSEQLVLDLLFTGTTEAAQLQTGAQLDTREFNQTLTMLEISGKIRPLGADRWSLS